MAKRTFERNTNPRKFMKILKANGWTIDRNCKSSHVILQNGDQKVMVKAGKINAMIQQRLVKELDLERG